MKNSLISISVATLALALSSCGRNTGPQGQVVGATNKVNYSQFTPLGMVNVPSGVLRAGAGDEDIQNALDAQVRTVNIVGFYMDATEITNAEYRQFTNWVRDSIAHTLLGNFTDNDDGTQSINWKAKIKYDDQDTRDQLIGLISTADQNIDFRSRVDVSKLVYAHKYADREAAAMNPTIAPTNFIYNRNTRIYPDTTVWNRQFAYSNNDPIATQYNWFPAFDEYPVVGVNWHQANAFCHWSTAIFRGYKESSKKYYEGEYRLPTEMEWEWAARGGRQMSPYPWGGPYVMNKKGCYLANFKPMPGDYSADGGLYTVKANAYTPNDYGLYNMSGNVAEWTSTPYLNQAYSTNTYSDMNPDVYYRTREDDPEWMKRRVVKGGSWRDTKYFLNVAVRDQEFQDTAKAYIGFRRIVTHIAPSLSNR